MPGVLHLCFYSGALCPMGVNTESPNCLRKERRGRSRDQVNGTVFPLPHQAPKDLGHVSHLRDVADPGKNVLANSQYLCPQPQCWLHTVWSPMTELLLLLIVTGSCVG